MSKTGTNQKNNSFPEFVHEFLKERNKGAKALEEVYI